MNEPTVKPMPRPVIHEPGFDAGDPKSVKRRKDLIEAEGLREANDMRAVLAMPEGERVLYRLLGMTGIFKSSFNTNGLAMGFAEGQRHIGLLMLASIEAADPAAFIRMQTNHLNEKEASNA